MSELSTKKGESNVEDSSKLDVWFEEFINSLKVDKLQLQTKTVSKRKEKIYSSFINGNPTDVITEMRKTSSQYFIELIIKRYVTELKERKVVSNHLAFNLSDAKVLVWANIKEDDEDAENGLILAEAKINSEFSKYGFHISSTIVEDSDHLSTPPQYKSIK